MCAVRTKAEKINQKVWQKITALKSEGKTQLPPEMELCEEFGASRGTVRRALNDLVEGGMLRRIAGKGTFIRDGRSEELVEAGKIPLLGMAYDILALTEFRVKIIRAIARAASLKGLEVIILSPTEALNLIGAWLPTSKGPAQLAGLMSCSFTPESLRAIQESPHKMPYVALVDPDFAKTAEYAVVRLDEFVKVFEYLRSLGHRKICFLEHSLSTPLLSRINNAVEEVENMGHDINLAIRECYSDPIKVVEEVDHLLSLDKENRPTAILCYDDKVASWVVKALHMRGVSVPDEMSVMGRGDLEVCSSVSPSLTSISIMYDELGEQAIDLFIKQCTGKKVDNPIRKAGFRIVERESCAPVK